MQSQFSSKISHLEHYAHNVFLETPFAQSPASLLKNGHLFLSIFGERCHFFSDFYIE